MSSCSSSRAIAARRSRWRTRCGALRPAHVRYKHVTVVDNDIDIHDYAAVDWAIAYRVNAGEDDIVIMPVDLRRRPRSVDPQARPQRALFGTGKWNRMLIDATINLDHDPDPDLGGARFPPTVWPEQKDIDAVKARWSELGFEKKNDFHPPPAGGKRRRSSTAVDKNADALHRLSSEAK